jgi:hypothetical protein
LCFEAEVELGDRQVMEGLAGVVEHEVGGAVRLDLDAVGLEPQVPSFDDPLWCAGHGWIGGGSGGLIPPHVSCHGRAVPVPPAVARAGLSGERPGEQQEDEAGRSQRPEKPPWGLARPSLGEDLGPLLVLVAGDLATGQSRIEP